MPRPRAGSGSRTDAVATWARCSGLTLHGSQGGRVPLILEQTQSPPVSAAPINPVIMMIRFSSHMARPPLVSQLAGVVRPVPARRSYRAGRWSVSGREVETRGGERTIQGSARSPHDARRSGSALRACRGRPSV